MIWANRYRDMDAELEDGTEVILVWTTVDGRVVAGTNDSLLLAATRTERGLMRDRCQRKFTVY